MTTLINILFREFYFTPDALCADTYIRSYMDEAGYVPIAFVCNFPEVLAIGAYYEDIVAGLQQSAVFEIDSGNETLRLLEGWQKWLIPNGQGGFGLPRYIKQAEEGAARDEAAPTQQQRARSGSKELSATASEYVFSPSSPQK
jgi:hypothetical protein